jgi:hypothetical protein
MPPTTTTTTTCTRAPTQQKCAVCKGARRVHATDTTCDSDKSTVGLKRSSSRNVALQGPRRARNLFWRGRRGSPLRRGGRAIADRLAAVSGRMERRFFFSRGWCGSKRSPLRYGGVKVSYCVGRLASTNLASLDEPNAASFVSHRAGRALSRRLDPQTHATMADERNSRQYRVLRAPLVTPRTGMVDRMG